MSRVDATKSNRAVPPCPHRELSRPPVSVSPRLVSRSGSRDDVRSAPLRFLLPCLRAPSPSPAPSALIQVSTWFISVHPRLSQVIMQAAVKPHCLTSEVQGLEPRPLPLFVPCSPRFPLQKPSSPSYDMLHYSLFPCSVLNPFRGTAAKGVRGANVSCAEGAITPAAQAGISALSLGRKP